jgi:hypothetical protein
MQAEKSAASWCTGRYMPRVPSALDGGGRWFEERMSSGFADVPRAVAQQLPPEDLPSEEAASCSRAALLLATAEMAQTYCPPAPPAIIPSLNNTGDSVVRHLMWYAVAEEWARWNPALPPPPVPPSAARPLPFAVWCAQCRQWFAAVAQGGDFFPLRARAAPQGGRILSASTLFCFALRDSWASEE